MDADLRRLMVDLATRMLFERTGQVLGKDRHWRIDTAIDIVLRNRGISTSQELVVLLTQAESAALQQELVEALLNNETYFFRDRHVFNHLITQVLPAIAEDRAASRRLSIWCAGCSTGQEPLSLAMALLDQQQRWAGWKIEIIGTDVSSSAIATARKATYTQFEIQRGLGVGQMLAHFTEHGKNWKASDRLRQMIRYEQRNLLDGPPAGMRFDLVLCRNLLLYLDPAARRTACRHLASAMAPNALLLLGGGEAILEHTDLLMPASGDCGLFRLSEVERAKVAAQSVFAK